MRLKEVWGVTASGKGAGAHGQEREGRAAHRFSLVSPSSVVRLRSSTYEVASHPSPMSGIAHEMLKLSHAVEPGTTENSSGVAGSAQPPGTSGVGVGRRLRPGVGVGVGAVLPRPGVGVGVGRRRLGVGVGVAVGFMHGHGAGVGLGLRLGTGHQVGVGVGVGVAVGVGVGVAPQPHGGGVGVPLGVGVRVGLGLRVGVGVGVAVGSGPAQPQPEQSQPRRLSRSPHVKLWYQPHASHVSPKQEASHLPER